MPICPQCSREVGAIGPHKRVCGRPIDPNLDPCLCGFQAFTSKQRKVHYKTCSVWQSRDKKAVMASKIRRTSLRKYGTEHPRQAQEVKDKQAQTNLERYGAVNVFCKNASTFKKVQAAIPREGLHGADNPFAKPEVQEKIKDHWRKKFGVEHNMQVQEIKEKAKV